MILNDIQRLLERERNTFIGICTSNFSFLHDALKILKDRNIPHTVLEPGSIWETSMDCLVIDLDLEVPKFKLNEPTLVRTRDDPEETIERALACAFGRSNPQELIVGVDPGKRPGLAFMSDGVLIAIQKAITPKEVEIRILRAKRAYGPRSLLVRIGDGDPENRDPIVKDLKNAGIPLEIVDESRTTTTKRFRDENAAVLIVHTKGRPV